MTALKYKIRSLTSGTFLRDVLKLTLGTVFGRAITLFILPLVTRLYSPEDFALLAVYLALVSLVSIISCFRLEIAIPLADDDNDAVNLLALALLALLFVSTLALIVALLLPATLGKWLGKPEIAPYLWLVPLGVAMAGSYSAFQFWATRKRRFGLIGRTRIGQAVAGAATILSFGWAGIVPIGIILGNAINVGAGGLTLAFQALRTDRDLLHIISFKRMIATLQKYYRYPVYSTPEALFFNASIHVPVLIIAAYGGSEAGFLFLAMQIMTAPLTLLGASISQVYMSRAPEALHEGRLHSFTLSIMRRLALVGTGPLIAVGLLAPSISPWLFGSEWLRLGWIVTWLTPWMVFQFIARPVSTVLYTVNRQRWAMYLQLTGLICRSGAVLFALYADPSWMVPAYAMSSTAFYILYIFVVSSASRVQST